MSIPVQQLIAAYEDLFEEWIRLSASKRGRESGVEARELWAKLLKGYALAELARATQRVAEDEQAMEDIRIWSQRCGPAAIPYLLNLWTSCPNRSVRAFVLIVIIAVCAMESGNSDVLHGLENASHQTALPSRMDVNLDHPTALPTVSLNIEGLSEPISLADALAITHGWDATNRRRIELIEKELSGELSAVEVEELQRLQKLAWAKRNITVPLPVRELALIRAAVERERDQEE